MNIKSAAYFEDIDFHLKQVLLQAKESVKICVAWISWSSYSSVFQELVLKNVSVEIIYNNDNINHKNFFPLDKGVTLYPVKGRFYNSLMHNKFCIVDSQILITGSFNWSNSARKHFENIVVIENDFHLILDFLHEFEDLKNYFSEYGQQHKIQCLSDNYPQCRSASYNIGILGHESGLYDESIVEIWNICTNCGHVNFIQEEYEHHLQTYLGLKEAPNWEDEPYDKYSMLNEFKQDRKQIIALQNYFNKSSGAKVNAIGCVAMSNTNEHLEWGENPEYVINVIWRDMYYRKVIPDVLDSSYDEIESIIKRHI